MASCGRPSPATRSVLRRAPATAGLHGAEETARWSSKLATEGNEAGVRGVDRAGSDGARGICRRAGILWREQDAHPVEDHRFARLGEPSTRLARYRKMIQITPQIRILVAVEAVDFRNGIDGLARVCKQQLQADPFSGGLFVFRNRRRTAVKVLVYDGHGFWLCQKRLSIGRFRFWPTSATAAGQTVEAHELQILLMGGNPASAQTMPAWRRVPTVG